MTDDRTTEPPPSGPAPGSVDPMFDEHGYPHDATLDFIEHWPVTDLLGLLEFLRRCWKYPNYYTRDGTKIKMSTGGWSGNESVIHAFEANTVAWMVLWESSHRGGHYTFEIPEYLSA